MDKTASEAARPITGRAVQVQDNTSRQIDAATPDCKYSKERQCAGQQRKSGWDRRLKRFGLVTLIYVAMRCIS